MPGACRSAWARGRRDRRRDRDRWDDGSSVRAGLPARPPSGRRPQPHHATAGRPPRARRFELVDRRSGAGIVRRCAARGRTTGEPGHQARSARSRSVRRAPPHPMGHRRRHRRLDRRARRLRGGGIVHRLRHAHSGGAVAAARGAGRHDHRLAGVRRRAQGARVARGRLRPARDPAGQDLAQQRAVVLHRRRPAAGLDPGPRAPPGGARRRRPPGSRPHRRPVDRHRHPVDLPRHRRAGAGRRGAAVPGSVAAVPAAADELGLGGLRLGRRSSGWCTSATRRSAR